MMLVLFAEQTHDMYTMREHFIAPGKPHFVKLLLFWRTCAAAAGFWRFPIIFNPVFCLCSWSAVVSLVSNHLILD